jgi:hypothetical protein
LSIKPSKTVWADSPTAVRFRVNWFTKIPAGTKYPR